MPTYRKRGSSWQVQVRVTGHPAESRSFPTKAHGKLWGEARETELKGGINTPKGMTLGSLIADYRAVATQTNREFLNAFRNRCGYLSTPLTALTKQQFKGYRTQALETQTALSFNRSLKAIRAMFRWAVKDRNYSADLLSCLDDLALEARVVKRQRRLFAHEEQRLREVMDSKLNAVLTVLLETGMRIGETSKMEKNFIHNGMIYLPAKVTKTKTPRTVVLSPRGQEAIDLLVSISPGERLLVDTTDQNLRRAIKRAGLVDFRIHDCRHEALSRMSETGLFGPAELMAQSGHKSLAELSTYIHSNPMMLRQKLQMLNQRQQTSHQPEQHSNGLVHLPHSSFVPMSLEVQPTLELAC